MRKIILIGIAIIMLTSIYAETDYEEGNVAIGSTSPDTMLVVTRFNDVWADANQIAISSHGVSNRALQIGYLYNTGFNAGGRIQALDDGSPVRLVLNPEGGSIGIGTDDPGAKLHVKASDSGHLPNQVAGLFVENSGSASDWYVFQTATQGGGKSFSVTNAGNVGIGTDAPSEQLTIYNPDTTGQGGMTFHRGRYARFSIISDNYWAGIEIRTNKYAPTETGHPHIDFTHNFTANYGIRIHAEDDNRLLVTGGRLETPAGLVIETRADDPDDPATGQIWLIT